MQYRANGKGIKPPACTYAGFEGTTQSPRSFTILFIHLLYDGYLRKVSVKVLPTGPFNQICTVDYSHITESRK